MNVYEFTITGLKYIVCGENREKAQYKLLKHMVLPIGTRISGGRRDDLKPFWGEPRLVEEPA